MKFAWPVLSDSIKARIEEHTWRRFGVVDRFLNNEVGTHWSLRPRLIPVDFGKTPRKDMWEFALQSNYLLRLHKAGRLKCDSLKDIPELTVAASRFEHDFHALCLVGATQTVADDLATAWHPKFHGRSIFPSEAGLQQAWQSICVAFELLSVYPDFVDLVRSECGAICFVDSKPAMEEGQCISLVSKLVPGLVYISAVPPILLVESLVHESAHLRFRGIEEITELYLSGPDLRVNTPLRTDPRPISGLMHQLLVLRYLAALFENLCTSSLAVIDRQRAQVEKRFQLHVKDLDAGKRMAKEVNFALTPDGRKLLERLLDVSESTLL